jgi:WD40 repeat protein
MLNVWDLRAGRQCLTRSGTNIAFAFHPREEVIVIQEAPNETVWLDLPSGTERLRWTAPFPRPSGHRTGWHTLAFSPNGRLLAGASAGMSSVELMKADTGEQLRVLTNNSRTVAMCWSPDGTSLAISTTDSRVLIWNAATGALEWSSPTMIASAQSLAFHPYRDWLAAGCYDGKVRFIDTHQQRFIFEFPGESRRLDFSPHGIRLGPVWSQGQLGCLETHRAEAFTSFGVGRSMDRLTDGAFSPDGKVLLIGHSDAVMISNPHLGRRIRPKNDWRMSTSTFHPRENYLLASDRKGISRYTHELAGARITLTPLGVIHPGTQWRALAFTPDGQRFAGYSSQSNAIFVFDETLTNQLAAFGPHTNTDTLALSPNGRWLTTASRSDRTVRLWDVSAEELIQTLPAGTEARSVFSGDGRWLAVTGDRFRLLETGTWTPGSSPRFSEENPILGAAAFSPDSRMLAIVVNRFEVHLFDLRTFESIGILRPPGAIQMLSLVFSPDGSQLAGTGAEARVAVWNMRAVEQSLADFGLAWDSAR